MCMIWNLKGKYVETKGQLKELIPNFSFKNYYSPNSCFCTLDPMDYVDLYGYPVRDKSCTIISFIQPWEETKPDDVFEPDWKEFLEWKKNWLKTMY